MRSKKNIIMIAICVAVLFMVTVYAVLQTNLNITGAGNITTNWQVEITNITSSFVGDAYDISTPTYTGTTATFNAGLYKPGDRVDYSITVTNRGTVDAIIDDVVVDTQGSPYIIYEVSDLQYDVKLEKQKTITFTLSAEFDINATVIPEDKTKNITMNIICVQTND